MNRFILTIALLLAASVQAGSGNLPQVTGQTVLKAHTNDIRSSLYVNIMPRNSSGTVVDAAGTVGEDALRWSDGFYDQITSVKYIVGLPGSGLNVVENGSNNLSLQVGGG